MDGKKPHKAAVIITIIIELKQKGKKDKGRQQEGRRSKTERIRNVVVIFKEKQVLVALVPCLIFFYIFFFRSALAMREAAGQMTSQPRLPPAPSSWTDARVRDQRLHSKYKKRTGPYEHVTCYVYRDDGDKTKEGWVFSVKMSPGKHPSE